MGESKCFMKEKTLKELEAAERSLEGEVVVEEIKAETSVETMRVSLHPYPAESNLYQPYVLHE